MYPENVTLYLEDIEEIIKLLGKSTFIKVGNVKYNSIEAISKTFRRKTLKGLTLKNSNGEYLSLSENGYINIHTKDRITEMALTNFLFSKQQKVNSFIEKLIGKIHKVFSITILTLIITVIIFSPDKELKTKTVEILISIMVCFQFLPLLTIYLPRRNYIYCRTSNEEVKFWETDIFKNIFSGVIGGLIFYLIQFILFKFGLFIP